MLYVFGCHDVSAPAIAQHSRSLFQTGWFVESVVTQTLIIHVIRTNKVPFVQSRPSRFLLATSGLIVALGVVISSTSAGEYLGFSPLPLLFWPFLGVTLLGYLTLTQVVKRTLVRRGWI